MDPQRARERAKPHWKSCHVRLFSRESVFDEDRIYLCESHLEPRKEQPKLNQYESAHQAIHIRHSLSLCTQHDADTGAKCLALAGSELRSAGGGVAGRAPSAGPWSNTRVSVQ